MKFELAEFAIMLFTYTYTEGKLMNIRRGVYDGAQLLGEMRGIARQILDRLDEFGGYHGLLFRSPIDDGGESVDPPLLLQHSRFCNPDDSDLTPPLEKTSKLWDGNPFCGCYFREYDGQAVHIVDYGSGQPQIVQDFLTRVVDRYSFPVAALEGDGLVIYVSLSGSGALTFDRATASLNWMAAQNVASPSHTGFQNVCAALPLTENFDCIETAFGLLMLSLCSGNGLGWNRTWILKKTANSWKCMDCYGAVSGNEWKQSLLTVEKEFGSIVDELAWCHLSTTVDLPLQSIFGNGNFSVPCTELTLPREPAENDRWFDVPFKLAETTHSFWHSASTSKEYVPDDSLYGCRLNICDEEYLIVLSSGVFTDRQEVPLIETAAYLAAASSLFDALYSDKENSFLLDLEMRLKQMEISTDSFEAFHESRLTRRSETVDPHVQEHMRVIAERMGL